MGKQTALLVLASVWHVESQQRLFWNAARREVNISEGSGDYKYWAEVLSGIWLEAGGQDETWSSSFPLCGGSFAADWRSSHKCRWVFRTIHMKPKPSFLSLSLLLFYTTWCAGPAALPLRLSVVNALSDKVPGSYSSSVVEGGVLMGALRRLQETQHDFK